jgi:hypothetical protein
LYFSYGQGSLPNALAMFVNAVVTAFLLLASMSGNKNSGVGM